MVSKRTCRQGRASRETVGRERSPETGPTFLHEHATISHSTPRHGRPVMMPRYTYLVCSGNSYRRYEAVANCLNALTTRTTACR